MEWEAVIESIGAQVESHERRDMFDEVEELATAEHASVTFAERIRGSLGRQGTITIAGEKMSGQFVNSGMDWLIFRCGKRVDIVPFHALEDVTGLTVAVVQPTRYCPTFNAVLRRFIDTPVQLNRLTRSVDGYLRAVGRDYVVMETGSLGGYADHGNCDRIRTGTSYTFAPVSEVSSHEHFLPLVQIKMISQARS